MQNGSRGFTLIELMVAITVLGILFAVALPSYREFTRSNRVTAAQNDLVTAFTYARSEAVRRSLPVSVCASADAATCAGTESWASGWIVFTDATGTAGAVDAGDTVLQRWGAVNGDILLTGKKGLNPGGTAAAMPYVQYQPAGTVSPDAATFDVYADGCTGPKRRRVAVTIVGSLSSTKMNCPSS